jgi:superoxide dismutase
LQSAVSVPLQWNGKGNFIGKHMDQIIQASDLALHQVKERFNLQQVWDDQFFWECQGELPEINDYERHWLEHVKDDFSSLAEYLKSTSAINAWFSSLQ